MLANKNNKNNKNKNNNSKNPQFAKTNSDSIDKILEDVKKMAEKQKQTDLAVEELFSNKKFVPKFKKENLIIEEDEESIDGDIPETDSIFDSIIQEEDEEVLDAKGKVVEVKEPQKKESTQSTENTQLPKKKDLPENEITKDKYEGISAEDVFNKILKEKNLPSADEIGEKSLNSFAGETEISSEITPDIEPVSISSPTGSSVFEEFEDVTSNRNDITDKSVKTADEQITNKNQTLQNEQDSEDNRYFSQNKSAGDKTRVFKKNARNENSSASADSINPEEEKMEAEFKKTRQKKIDQFRVFAEKISGTDIPEEPDDDIKLLDTVKMKKGEDIFTAVEKIRKPKKENAKKTQIRKKRESKVYEKIDVGRVKIKLEADKRAYSIRLIVVLALLGVTAVSEIIRLISLSGNISLSLLLDKTPVLVYPLALILGLPALVLSITGYVRRLKENEKHFFCSELSIVVVCVFNTINNLILTLNGAPVDKSVMSFNFAVYFSMLLACFADKKENRMISANLATLIKNEKFLGVYSLGTDCTKVASGITNSEKPTVLCAGEVEIPNSFLDSSLIKDKQNNFFKFAVPVLISGGLICAIVALVTYQSLSIASTAFMSAVAIMCPAFLTYVLTSLLANTNESLNRLGCEILGFEAIEYMDDADAVVLDTTELFAGEISHFHLITPTAKTDTMSAFLIALSALYASGGVLKSDAEKLIKEEGLNVPQAEDVTYEERLGISCWIENRCVLLGNIKMMQEHNIEIPAEYAVPVYEQQGARTFFLAVDGTATAVFAAEYFISKQAKKQLKKLYTTGIILMLLTNDPNIDEEFVAVTLDADVSSIKTISPASANLIRKNINETAKQKRTGLIFKKSVAGLVKVINCALRLYDVQTLTFLIQTIGMIFGFGVSFLLSLAATGYTISPLLIVPYHILWIILSKFTARRSK